MLDMGGDTHGAAGRGAPGGSAAVAQGVGAAPRTTAASPALRPPPEVLPESDAWGGPGWGGVGGEHHPPFYGGRGVKGGGSAELGSQL